MESLTLRRSSTQAKMVGTIVSISGALVVVLYKGPIIVSILFTNPSISINSHLHSLQSDWIMGGLLLTAQYIFYTLWYILQTDIMRMYPEKLAATFFYSLGVAIVTAPVTFIAERNSTVWTHVPAIAFVAIVYWAMCSATTNIAHSWGLHVKGPLYVAMFKPLGIALAAFMSNRFLGEALHVGSIVGASIISIGFYTVFWGKANEEKDDSYGFTDQGASSSDKSPLLQYKK
ncbi:hypothetical protein ACFE04_009367 [Oxalis oulophora]